MKIKRYTLNHWKGKLSNGKWVCFDVHEKVNEVDFNVDIQICRSDICFKSKPKKERYFLRIEKYNKKYPGDKDSSELNEDKEFNTLEEIIDYLNQRGYLKREEWIVDEIEELEAEAKKGEIRLKKK